MALRPPKSGDGAPEESLPEQVAAQSIFDGGLRAARAQLDEYVRAWVRELTVARAALPTEVRKPNRKSVSELGRRLERLDESLRNAPARFEDNVRARADRRTPGNSPPEPSVDVHEEVRGRLLAAEGERRNTERALREVHARFETAFDSAPIGMALVDMGGRWLQVNDALCRISGYPREQLKATTLGAITHVDDVELDADSLRELLAGHIPSYQVEKRYRHAWGHHFWVLVTVSLVRGEGGEPLHLITQVQDISERREMAARLEYLVDHDFLTGLFNRRRFERELDQEVERTARYGGAGALLLIDLDNFKDVNDAFGHKAGDDLLKGISGALRHRIRQNDLLARIGGDEFAVLLPQADAEQAQTAGNGIVKTLGQQVAVLGDQSIHTTASVGIALFDGLSSSELLAFADLAMYEAKQAGRNRVAMHRPGGGRRERVSARLTEAERIRRALEEDRFLVYGQPILDLKERAVDRYELLLRLRDDEFGEPLLPSTFLYVAERFGLIQEIDCWVARKAIALIAEHARAGRSLVLHVNMSGKSIGDPKVIALTEEALAKADIDPTHLIFELTETAAIANIEEARAFAHRLRARGCQLALDDFGAGFGSFYYLKTLPFDYFKIDGDFIRGIAANPVDQLVVRAIVGIARGMNKKTIAEFVTDDATASLLEESGVDYAQGFHFGRPRPVADLLPLA